MVCPSASDFLSGFDRLAPSESKKGPGRDDTSSRWYLLQQRSMAGMLAVGEVSVSKFMRAV